MATARVEEEEPDFPKRVKNIESVPQNVLKTYHF